MNQLATLLSDHVIYHSTFQIQYLILARVGGTIYGAYRQALREIHKRVSALRQLEANKRPCQSNGLVLPQGHWDSSSYSATPDTHEREHTQDTRRELYAFVRIAAELKTRLGSLTPEIVDVHESQLWEHRVKCLAAVDFLSYGRIQQPTIELLQSLPLDLRRTLLALLFDARRHQELVDWYLTYDPEIPSLQSCAEIEIDQLLIECGAICFRAPPNCEHPSMTCDLSEQRLATQKMTP